MGAEQGPGFNPEMCQDRPSPLAELFVAKEAVYRVVQLASRFYCELQEALFAIRAAFKGLEKKEKDQHVYMG